MKKWKNILIATIGGLAILCTSVFASTGIVNAPNGLVLRKEANRTAEPITTIPHETQVEIIEETDEWYKVNYASQEGYLFSQYVEINEEIIDEPAEIQEEATIQPNNSTEMQTKNAIKVYVIPLITSTVINEIEINTNITIHKQITNWSYVSAGNIQGWVRTYGIGNENQSQETEQTTENTEEEQLENQETETTTPTTSTDDSEETPVEELKGYVNVNSANVRKETSTTSEIVTTLIKDTSFTITAETTEWYKIKYIAEDGTTYEGYIFKELVTTNN